MIKKTENFIVEVRLKEKSNLSQNLWNLLKLSETYYTKFHETSEIISRFEKTWNFPPLITGTFIGGAKVLSMTNLANVSTKNSYFSFTGPSREVDKYFR